MKCETCECEFPDSAVKVWSGKKVCPGCFRTLTTSPAGPSGSRFTASPGAPSFRVNPAAFIDIYILGADAPWFDGIKSDSLSLARTAWDTGRQNISAIEAKMWGIVLLVKIEARIAIVLAEDLGMPITDTQAIAIARNFLSGVQTGGGARLASEVSVIVQLTEEERKVAETIGYYAWKEFTGGEENMRWLPTEEQIRTLTSETIALGENRKRPSWKSAFSGVQQRARDRVYGASERAVTSYLALGDTLSAAYSEFGPSLGLDE